MLKDIDIDPANCYFRHNSPGSIYYNLHLRIPMLHIIWYIIIGFIAGALAKFIMHAHMSVIMTTILGIVGSIVGGLLARLFSRPAPGASFHPAGLILSVIGALIVLFVSGKLLHVH
jgi:uncharacterized membrane protein YeaQ/YmgE (transglycosylase-associated protein family)